MSSEYPRQTEEVKMSSITHQNREDRSNSADAEVPKRTGAIKKEVKDISSSSKESDIIEKTNSLSPAMQVGNPNSRRATTATCAADASVKAAMKMEREKAKMAAGTSTLERKSTFEERLKQKNMSGMKRDDHVETRRVTMGHAADAPMVKRVTEKMTTKSRSASMPTNTKSTFEERLLQKAELGRIQASHTETRRVTMGDVADADAPVVKTVTENMITKSRSVSMPTNTKSTFEERLKRKKMSDRNRDGHADMRRVTVDDAEIRSHSEIPNNNMFLDEAITRLLQFRERNGNLTISHPSVSDFIANLPSQELEPSFAEKGDESDVAKRQTGNPNVRRASEVNIVATKMERKSRSASMPTSRFEERLRQKFKQGSDRGPRYDSELRRGNEDEEGGADRQDDSADDLHFIEEDTSDYGNTKVNEPQSHSSTTGIIHASCTIQGKAEGQDDSKTELDEPDLSSSSFNAICSPLQLNQEPTAVKNDESDTNMTQEVRPRRRDMVRSRLGSFASLGQIFGGNDDTDEVLISATLVEEAEVVMAEPVGLLERKWKLCVLPTCITLTLLAVLLSLTLTGIINPKGKEVFMETSEPSSSPTFDPRTTLEIVQERGYIRCGLFHGTLNAGEGFNLDLCRAVAAVVVGDPDRFEGVLVTNSNRWQRLHGKTTDFLVAGDTHTIEREVREGSTGAGFDFSSPYTYDGMVYYGDDAHVQCAEEHKRYDECSDLLICAVEGSTHHAFLARTFPLDHIKLLPSRDDIPEMLFNQSCNVGTYDKSFIPTDESLFNGIDDGTYVLGHKMMTKEPLAIVSRNTDQEFSDIINWVVQALYFGEEQGLTKNETLCQNYTNNLTLHDVSELDFMNAVYCVGNYGELFDGSINDRGRNQINNGTGMLYAIPFGDLVKDTIVEPAADSTLSKIRTNQTLNCGVVVPRDFGGNVTGSDKLVGMGVDFCRALAAAIFVGDFENVKFITFPESDNSSFIALANETVDVLVGGKVERKYDFKSSPMLRGFHFSTPYYYGSESANDDVSFYSIATREDDVVFASFVNCIVLATIYAQENGVQREKSGDMPSVSVFGSNLNWALRDAIAYSGSYDEMYSRNFGSRVSSGGFGIFGLSLVHNSESGSVTSRRGRNALNDEGPLILSFPHLP